jgi:rhodanese-related sulfurtransferase
MVYVNCYSGQTSSQTVSLLRTAGKYAINIQGGWKAISAAEGIDAYTETTVNELGTTTYEVADEIEKAIADYYAAATSNTYGSFNFPASAAKELVDAQSDAYTFLSVRSADDYAAGHIPGAINIPFGKNMQESFNIIPKDKPVIVYCYSGQTSSQTLGILRLLGYEAYSLTGGSNGDAGALMTEK